jgi:hypothetical protein
MRQAFGSSKTPGPLADMSQVAGEQEAVSHLFAGAIGLFKNPGSHRDVNIDDPLEAAELVLLADRLIRIAERHAGVRTGT